MLGAIREDVTRTLAFATITFRQPDLPDMPDFVTHHIDPFTGEDDSADLDAATGNVLSRLPPLQVPRPDMPGDTAVAAIVPPASPHAPCPCGSGRKYKHDRRSVVEGNSVSVSVDLGGTRIL